MFQYRTNKFKVWGAHLNKKVESANSTSSSAHKFVSRLSLVSSSGQTKYTPASMKNRVSIIRDIRKVLTLCPRLDPNRGSNKLHIPIHNINSLSVYFIVYTNPCPNSIKISLLCCIQKRKPRSNKSQTFFGSLGDDSTFLAELSQSSFLDDTQGVNIHSLSPLIIPWIRSIIVQSDEILLIYRWSL